VRGALAPCISPAFSHSCRLLPEWPGSAASSSGSCLASWDVRRRGCEQARARPRRGVHRQRGAYAFWGLPGRAGGAAGDATGRSGHPGGPGARGPGAWRRAGVHHGQRLQRGSGAGESCRAPLPSALDAQAALARDSRAPGRRAGSACGTTVGLRACAQWSVPDSKTCSSGFAPSIRSALRSLGKKKFFWVALDSSSGQCVHCGVCFCMYFFLNTHCYGKPPCQVTPACGPPTQLVAKRREDSGHLRPQACACKASSAAG